MKRNNKNAADFPGLNTAIKVCLTTGIISTVIALCFFSTSPKFGMSLEMYIGCFVDLMCVAVISFFALIVLLIVRKIRKTFYFKRNKESN